MDPRLPRHYLIENQIVELTEYVNWSNFKMLLRKLAKNSMIDFKNDHKSSGYVSLVKYFNEHTLLIFHKNEK